MPALQDLQRKIKSAADLHKVVRTMKALAAVSIRQYEQAVQALEGYYTTVELGLRAVLRQRPLARTPERVGFTVVLLLGSDQGMAGRFNEAIVDFAAEQLAGTSGSIRFWVAGQKAYGGVEDRFGDVAEQFALPSSAQAITPVVQDVLLRFEALRRREGECRLLLLHNTPRGGATYGQRRLALLPPDERWLHEMAGEGWPGRNLPLIRAPWEELFSALVGEYLFLSLFSGFAFSLAAENAARLAAMQRAEKNIEELQNDLSSRYHSLRQSLATEELFDVIAGFEAQSGRTTRRP
jgi:F-type H+-transporting ATPase subunit gamma